MRKLQLSSILRASIEDNELFPVVTDETTSEVEETLIELDDAYDEASDAVEIVEELEDREEQAEELVEAVEGFIAEGGMSAEAASMYYMSLRNLSRGLESVTHTDFNPSIEGYASRDRMTASMEAKEDGKSFLKTLWETIVRLAQAAKDAIVNFFGRLKTSNGKISGKAQALKKRAQDLGRGAKVKEAKSFAGGTWTRNLADGRGDIAPGGTAGVITDLNSALIAVRATVAKGANEPLESPVDSLIKAVVAVGGKLPGSYSVEAGEGTFAVVRKDVATPDEVKPLSAQEAVAVCDAISTMMKTLDGYSKELETTLNKMSKEATKNTKDASKADKEAAANAKKRLASVRKAGLEFPRIATDAARSALVYVNKSLNAIGTVSDKDKQANLKDELKARRNFGG